MNRYKANHAHQNKPVRRTIDPISQQAEVPLARAPEPATHVTSQATAAARHQRRNSVRGTQGSMYTR
jgi:hypothetical protein